MPKNQPLIKLTTESDVYVVKYNEDGNYLMTGHADRTVKLWNAKKGVLVKTYEAVQNREVFDIAIFQDNGRFASCGGDKTFFLWDVLTGKYIRKITAHMSKINTLALNPQQNLIATGSFDNTVKIWDILNPQQFKPV